MGGGGDRDIYKILNIQQKLKTAPIYITFRGISNCLHEHNHTFSHRCINALYRRGV